MINYEKCLSSDTSTCSFTAILSFHHFIHLHCFHLVQLILRGHEECSCISPFQSAILEAATGSSTKIVGTKKWTFHSSNSIHLVFRCVSIRFFLVEGCWCKIEHHTSIFGFCAAASPKCPYKKKNKVQRWFSNINWRYENNIVPFLPNYLLPWRTPTFLNPSLTKK